MDAPLLVAHTVSEFCTRARELEKFDDGLFADFVLTGKYIDDELNDCQADVQPRRNALEEGYGIKALRDYDSILGYTKDLPMTDSIFVLPVGNAREVLRRSVHISVPLDVDGVDFKLLFKLQHLSLLISRI